MSTLSTFVLPNFQCVVICWCFSATCCCGGNGPILSKSHEKPHPISNWNLNLMWCLLIVHEFWWNFNMLFISMICNSLGKLFEFYINLLNCCVVKIFALCLSKTSSAIQCGEYLRDLALFDQLLLQYFSSVVKSKPDIISFHVSQVSWNDSTFVYFRHLTIHPC